MWAYSAEKIVSIEKNFDFSRGAPVFTINGKYATRGWTDWTQGFQYGSSVLQFDATNDSAFLDIGRTETVSHMASHVTHIGVHDHGFNNVSTYGNLLRLMHEERIPTNTWERNFYELAIKCSGAVQASRWTQLPDTGGYVYSFNGPHSLFSDTVRSLRVLIMANQLGHALMGENDKKINLLNRAVSHLHSTSKYNVYFGDGRDYYDIPGRVVHESIFNLNDRQYRCPSTQQGYTPFSTWTRGLAWILLGYAEQLEYFSALTDSAFKSATGGDGHLEDLLDLLLRTAQATADFYLEYTPTCGIPYWDTGAPGLSQMGDYLSKPADPYNDFEPVDSSAAAISAQGLLRLGRYLLSKNDPKGDTYIRAGFKVTQSLLSEPYISKNPEHQGLLLHSVYHRPNGWDHIPETHKVPCNESCLWGDYHLRELALYVQRLATNAPYYTYFLPVH